MKFKILIGFIFLAVFFYLLPEPETDSSQSKEPVDMTQSLNYNFIIRNARLYDGDKIYPKTDILVENSLVADIAENLANPNDYRELDAAGHTLLPGFIDAHTHTWGEALTQALNFGVTTELDMFTMPETSQPHQTKRDDLSNVNAADLFSATILATAPKGHGTQFGFKIPVLEEVEQVESFVKQRIEDGADYIKAVYQAKESEKHYYPSISKAILTELIRVSHLHNKKLVVHVDDLISAKHVIELGADGIIHSFMDRVVDQVFIDLMVTNNAFIVPTLSVQASVVGLSPGDKLAADSLISEFLAIEQGQQLKVEFKDFGIPVSKFNNAQQSVALLAKAGVTILAGSDAPNPGTAHGVSIHGEMAELVESGLTNEEAIHSATGAARKAFPIGLRGTLQKGAVASMILIKGNPFEDISITKNIQRIWKNGVQFERKLAKDEIIAEQPLTASIISDFNHKQTSTLVGSGLSGTTDQYIGGNSEVTLDYVEREKNSENFAMLVRGEVKSGSTYLWSGIGYLPGKSMTEGANLSDIKRLLFEAKGSDNFSELTVMLFQQGSQMPAMRKIYLNEKWQQFQINFDDLSNVDFRRISNISLVATGRLGTFEFSIDNLEFQ